MLSGSRVPGYISGTQCTTHTHTEKHHIDCCMLAHTHTHAHTEASHWLLYAGTHTHTHAHAHRHHIDCCMLAHTHTHTHTHRGITLTAASWHTHTHRCITLLQAGTHTHTHTHTHRGITLLQADTHTHTLHLIPKYLFSFIFQPSPPCYQFRAIRCIAAFHRSPCSVTRNLSVIATNPVPRLQETATTAPTNMKSKSTCAHCVLARTRHHSLSSFHNDSRVVSLATRHLTGLSIRCSSSNSSSHQKVSGSAVLWIFPFFLTF